MIIFHNYFNSIGGRRGVERGQMAATQDTERSRSKKDWGLQLQHGNYTHSTGVAQQRRDTGPACLHINTP
jgi:hypothetical protein